MNPYLQIAREHLSKEDLEMLLAEKEEKKAAKMSYETERTKYYTELFTGRSKKGKSKPRP